MDKPTTVFKMYAGLRTIGGVIFSVTYGRDRVLMEFGSAYDPATAVFDDKIEPRRKNWIRDKLQVGLLPKIDGIYRREDLGDYPLTSAEESDMNTAVFVTHLHLDHMASIGTLAPNVPVYMHRDAVTIERALEATGRGVETLERDYTDITPFEPIRVGAIEVLPILCRDSGYKDFAFHITTPDGTVHWTGDLCLHGLEKDKTLRQLEIVKERGADVMLCECTSFMDSVLSLMIPDCDPARILPSAELPAGMLSEADYCDRLFEAVKDLPGLCVFNYYQRETDDAARFLEWAAATGRVCAFEPDAAYIVYKFFGKAPAVYIPDTARYACPPAPWLAELLANAPTVTTEDVRRNPRGYMIQNSYENIMELFSLSCKDSVYLHADGIPIGAFDPKYDNMRRIVRMAGFSYMTCFLENYFGHGYPAQVKYFVDEIDPRVLIPCHSYNPERLLPNTGLQLLPEPYQAYRLENHTLIPIDATEEV